MHKLPAPELQRRFQKDGADFIFGLRAEFGDAVYADVPLIGRVTLLFHPDHAYELLVKHADQTQKPPLMRKLLGPSFGNGLFTSEGDLWKHQRRLIQPTFHHAKIGRFAGQMIQHSAALSSTWRAGEIVTIDAAMHALTFTIAIDTLFTSDGSSDAALIGESMGILGKGLAAQSRNIFLALLPEWLPVAEMTKKRQAVETINTVIHQMVAARRALGEDASPPDLLSALVFSRDADTHETMSDAQLRDELMTLFIAGHETTAVLMAWAWILLADHPAVAATLHAELDAVLDGRDPTLADVPRLPYTAQVIHEALRLYPPSWMLFRTPLAPITVGEVPLNTGGIAFIFPYANQRDARWFDQPDAFLPERWTPDYEKALPKGAYFPFGMGPRVCIGNGFAQLEATLLLATLANRWTFTRLDTPELLPGGATLGFAHPVRMRVDPRGSTSRTTPNIGAHP